MILLLALATAAGQQRPKSQTTRDQKREESNDYFKKWLEEDVLYIITDEEKEVFQKLSTDQEREQFIEQFWLRRDPNPRTAINEFKEEHYRRIAYANEKFSSGLPGWLTDRGRIYITHGEPAEIESYPSGGTYFRPDSEGGGDTYTFPFEIWRYRHIDGLGDDVLLEFVDRSFSGEYKLALNPEEKDMLLYTPGGLTAAEQMGLSKSKRDRPFFSPGTIRYPFLSTRINDSPFERYYRYAKIDSPPPVKYKDLKEVIDVQINYTQIPIRVRNDFYKLNDNEVLAPVTLQIDNKDLTFSADGDRQIARVALYGVVTGLSNRVIKEFDDDLSIVYSSQDLQQVGLTRSSIYQKLLILPQGTRCKLDLVVKDLNSGQIGVKSQALAAPRFGSEKLETSSLVLAPLIEILQQIPEDNPMFVIGDVKVRPSLSKTFREGFDSNLYLQVYNAAIDQSTSRPSLKVSYRIRRGEKAVAEMIDLSGESIQLASDQRVVLIKRLPIAELVPGSYHVEVEVEDLISRESVQVSDDLRVEAYEPSH